MLDPLDLFEVHDAEVASGAPVLVVALQGFVDAGSTSQILVNHLLETLPSTRLVTFDVDQLIDYRSRRPAMVFDSNSWQSYDEPKLVIDTITDEDGTQFLLMHGLEPDVQWERYVRAVRQIIEDYEVSLTLTVQGIPMAVPHTRPLTTTTYATRSSLVADQPKWFTSVQVPASVQSLLEYRLGHAGNDAMGIAVNVPHYLAQSQYPQAAQFLITQVEAATGLNISSNSLEAAAQEASGEIAKQIEQAPEVEAVVHTLEQHYDSMVSAAGRPTLLPEPIDMPTAEELGAEFERFLAEQSGPDQPSQ